MVDPVGAAVRKFFSISQFPMLFAGAGVSAYAGLPSWKDLVIRLAEGLRAHDPLTTQQMLELVHTGDLTLAMDYFRLSNRIADGDKHKLLTDQFESYDAMRLSSLAALPFRGFLTTNFDRSLLDAIALKRGSAARDYRYGDSSFKRAQWEEALFVARIHGAVESPDSIVLSKTQFDTLLGDDAYTDFLRQCFTHRCILFLGFSFYDPAIRHVLDDINKRFGSAPPGRHMALLPSGVAHEFLQRANRLNIEVVQYDPVNDHELLWKGLSTSTTSPVQAPPPTTPFDFTKRYLAACYARAKTTHSASSLRDAVTEGIVSAMLQECAPGSLSKQDLLEKLRQALGLKGKDAEKIFDSATKALVEAKLCRRLRGTTKSGAKFAWIGEAEKDDLDAAVQVLTKSVVNRAYLQEGWKTGVEVDRTVAAFFGELVRRRGWDLGAAFAAGRHPDNLAVKALLADSSLGLPAFDMERLGRVMETLFQHPTQEETAVLAELGRVSFAVELAFQSPKSTLLHKAVLPRKLYFDASVLMPALVEGHPLCAIYGKALASLVSAASKAAISLKRCVCTVYLNEIISHKRNALDYARHLGADFPAIARSDALFHGVPNVNVYVGAYANWVNSHEAIAFDDFLNRFAPYSTESELRKWLTSKGFEVVGAIKGQKYAMYYSQLETAYADPLMRGKDAILIEHDATQVSMLEGELQKGDRTLFVTADKQLQLTIANNPRFAPIANALISHAGLVQFIDLLIGGVSDSTGLTELLWSSRVSDRAEEVRSYFTMLALEEYDEGMAMTLAKVVEKYAEVATQELVRKRADLEAQDPLKRAGAFRTLGSLEETYFAKMREAVDKAKESKRR